MPYSWEFTWRYISWRFPNTTSTWKLLIRITSLVQNQRDEASFEATKLKLIEEIFGSKLAWSPNSICWREEGRSGGGEQALPRLFHIERKVRVDRMERDR